MNMSTTTQISDVMTRNVITVYPGTPVIEAARLLITHHIGGMPVVDLSGRVVGMISKKDLFLKKETITGTSHTFSALFQSPVLPQFLAEVYALYGAKCVAADIMTRKVAWVTEIESIGIAAQRMEQFTVNRLPVFTMDPEVGGRLIGIVTRSDIIQYLIDQSESPSALNVRLNHFSGI